MSIASEYAKKVERPEVKLTDIDGGITEVYVTDEGYLGANDICSEFEAKEAIKLAHWILQTFDDVIPYPKEPIKKTAAKKKAKKK